ncbi:MAG: hypothetical protein HYV09_14555 [Deltaproteobacteria bacterium]|nr:hypothetical protein [Deltaproteobacteria bacterium]
MSPAHVLAVYAEPLVAGRRVAILAPEDASLVEAVLALGARLLYVYDPRPSVDGPRRGADPRVTVAPLRAGDLGVREGAFDLALIPDLSLLGDAEAALAYVRRLVGGNGVALIGCRNREAGAPWTRAPEGAPSPSYTEFYDLCALQFAEVRMAGVAPFAAYAIAEFAPEREPTIAFDASLVAQPDPPEWFVAIAAQSSTHVLEAYEIIQLPRESVAVEATTDPGELDALRAQVGAADQRRQEAEARAGEDALRAERLSNELRAQHEEVRKLRDRTARLTKELDDERRAHHRASTDLEAARANPELSQLRERTLALEAELIEARTQLATPRAAPNEARLQQERESLAAEVTSVRQALEQARTNAEQLRQRVMERERELAASRAQSSALEARLAEQVAVVDRGARDAEAARVLAERATQAETTAARASEELVALQVTHEHDVASLEAALRSTGEDLRQAKIELARRERMVRELVAQVEEAGGGQLPVPIQVIAPPPELLQELDLARRELATLVAEIRRRDRALEEARSAFEAARAEVESERARTEALARDAARREAALQTASWRIAELERLGADGGEEPGRGEAAAELDALRRALAQEHAKVESLERALSTTPGDDLRTRLQQQEALIAQLSTELAQAKADRQG